MTKEDFLRSIKAQVSDAALFGVQSNLRHPPGRKPSPRDLQLSHWWERLSNADREVLLEIIRNTAELATFNFLCVLDEVSTIEDGSRKGSLKLIYSNDDTETTLNTGARELLHDIYNHICGSSDPRPPDAESPRRYVVGTARELREILKVSDGLDIHSVGYTESAASSEDEEPSMALPKNEHKRM